MPAMQQPRLRTVGERPPAVRFAECVRAVTSVARRAGLGAPAFRSPPGIEGIDRTLRRRSDGSAVVAVRLVGRPFCAVEADVIEGFVVANRLTGRAADRFRRAAWIELEGGPPVRRRPSVPMPPPVSDRARVA